MENAREGKPEDDELVHAREMLARTVRFLSHCASDPEAALRAEDPQELIRGLESLSIGPAQTPAVEPLPEARTIQIRRRKSA